MIIKNSEFHAAYGTEKQLPKGSKPEVVFSGRSNVGKSSLINKICNRKSLARTSSAPGKTATINFYRVNDFYFVDLPGYGYAKISNRERARWDKLINGYFKSNRDLRLVVQLLDCRIDPTKDDLTMLDYLTQMEIPFIIALTKGDKLNKTEQSRAVEKYRELCAGFSYDEIILTSTLKGTGIEELNNTIERYLG
ncbi:MAG: YihA family ribosome biogenesis GTP-binding protein [Firmicutes bacterium]|nr:YihA family ribosome biogenesis GTP-binding protein [Oscillospiraceae bacterium]MBQ6536763.1 YihA family ribosome biogenesis GTP-binding protein [Bacillota bacterium]